MPFVGYSYHNSDGELCGHFREFFHTVTLMLIKRMVIGFQSNRGIRVTEYFAQCFNIKSKLQSANAERVPQGYGRLRILLRLVQVFAYDGSEILADP